MRYEYSSYTDVGGRKNNEDACYAGRCGQNYLFVVADGLGGHASGEVASNLAVSVIRKRFEEACGAACRDEEEITVEVSENGEKPVHRHPDSPKIPAPGSFTAVFDAKAAIEEANREILAVQKRSGKEMKTTVALAVICGGEATFAHVGDSRIYAFSQGKILYQSPDHSASQMAVLAGEITADQIRHHVDRNILLRALGAGERLKVDVVKTEAAKIDALLLCSDGFWEYVTEDQMCRTMAGGSAQWLAAMRKIVRAEAPRNHDNNTAVTVTGVRQASDHS